MTAPRPRSLALIHPIGNAFVREAALAFSEAGILLEFHLALAASGGNLMSRIARLPGFHELERRRYPSELAPSIRLHPLYEVMRLFSSKLRLKSLVRHETGAFSVDSVFLHVEKQFAKRIRKLQPEICYGYEDGASQCFIACKDIGGRCVYDLPIGYWRAARRIQAEEQKLQPDWADTMPALIDSDAKCARKDRELELADQVVVASRFTANTLSEAPHCPSKIDIIPYGCPSVHDSASSPRTTGKKLRVLFVGSLSQRKGLAYLLQAIENCGSAVELTLIGRPVGQCRPRDAALKQHRWIESLPHNRILEEMRQHDVLVFPSLFEGFGLVVTEALSQGIPVITTPHTCGPDILTDGEDGFIVPIRSSEAIAEKLLFLHDEPERLAQMKQETRRTAEKNSWALYRQRLVEAVVSAAE